MTHVIGPRIMFVSFLKPKYDYELVDPMYFEVEKRKWEKKNQKTTANHSFDDDEPTNQSEEPTKQRWTMSTNKPKNANTRPPYNSRSGYRRKMTAAEI